MHARARVFFAAGLLLGAAVLTAGVAATLAPTLVPIATSHEVAIAKFDQLVDGVPLLVGSDQLTALARKAWDLRAAGPYRQMSGPRVGKELPIWLVRSGYSVRAFIAIDPRNSCRLDTQLVTEDSRVPPSITIFHDVCHGSLYDLGGDRYGGPAPWTLDELVVSVRAGLVFADRTAVHPGRLVVRY
jgi:hypothetical protein